MTTATVALATCGVYLVATLVMGLLPGLRVSRSVAGYVAADRSMDTLVLYFVLGASIFSSFAFLGAPGWAYSRGLAALYVIAYGILGMVPFYFVGPRVRRLGERYGFVTQAELLAHRFDSRPLSVLMALLSLGAFVPYLVLQMQGAGLILSTLTDGRISLAAGAAAAYGVVLVYVLWSGVLGVGWTNTFQGVFMMAIAWFLGLYLPYQLHGGVGPMFDAIRGERPELLMAPGLAADGSSWTWAAFGSSVLVSAIGFTMWPHLFMKAYAARSDRSLRLTVVLYPTFQIFLVPILFIGFAGVVSFPGVEPADSILPHLLVRLEVPALLVGLVCAGALAASMSSGDSILHAAASIVVRDGIRPLSGGGLDDRRERGAIRVAVLVVSLVAYYFAVVSRVDLVALLLAAYGGVAQIMPPVLAALYWPRVPRQAPLAGLAAGIAVNCLFLLRPELKPIAGLHEGVFGLAANVVVLGLVALLSRVDERTAARGGEYLRT
ncbi:MAG: sodium:solute symporter family protein [Acidobacteria bacterium]|nr:MAG: sodium:solute symporter family protein [Acidobacteriota bacterium]REJ99388.1 MAG: sodium:solute symporter family protein [Acidobacteriota bacterium]